jgi:large subunit ribosomal protein L30
MTSLRITQIRSAIGSKPKQRGTLRALGLRRINHTVEHPDKQNGERFAMMKEVFYLE